MSIQQSTELIGFNGMPFLFKGLGVPQKSVLVDEGTIFVMLKSWLKDGLGLSSIDGSGVGGWVVYCYFRLLAFNFAFDFIRRAVWVTVLKAPILLLLLRISSNRSISTCQPCLVALSCLVNRSMSKASIRPVLVESCP